MKIATCLTADGAIGTPFEASSICVFERSEEGWKQIQSFDYFPVPDMGVNHARLLLEGIASLIHDCEVFLLAEMRGYAHVWLGELGFRTWKSEGTLFEQLDSVAAQDALSADEQTPAEPGACGTVRGCGGGGCGGSCGAGGTAPQSACASSRYGAESSSLSASFGSGATIPEPEPVGEATARHYRVDLAAILDAEPSLNSRQVLLPVLEKGDFLLLEVHLGHLPKWFAQTLESLGLEAEISDAIAPSLGLIAWITPKSEGRKKQ